MSSVRAQDALVSIARALRELPTEPWKVQLKSAVELTLAAMDRGVFAENVGLQEKVRGGNKASWPGPAVAWNDVVIHVTGVPSSKDRFREDCQAVADAIEVEAEKMPGEADQPPEDWITVTEAAKIMIDRDFVDNLNFENAKARISKACGEGNIKFWGKGQSRRIDPGSLSEWMWEVRKKQPDLPR